MWEWFWHHWISAFHWYHGMLILCFLHKMSLDVGHELFFVSCLLQRCLKKTQQTRKRKNLLKKSLYCMPQGQSHMAAIITKVLILLYGRNVLAQDIETFAIYFSLFCFFGKILFFTFFFFFLWKVDNGVRHCCASTFKFLFQ